MSDLISRQEAIDKYGEWYVEEGTAEGFIGTVRSLLEALPSVEPERKWIPRKTPPKRDGWYLVYAPTYTGGSSHGKENHNGIMFARYQTASWLIEKGYYKRPNLVRAWMELPRPPEEGSKNEV